MIHLFFSTWSLIYAANLQKLKWPCWVYTSGWLHCTHLYSCTALQFHHQSFSLLSRPIEICIGRNDSSEWSVIAGCAVVACMATSNMGTAAVWLLRWWTRDGQKVECRRLYICDPQVGFSTAAILSVVNVIDRRSHDY